MRTINQKPGYSTKSDIAVTSSYTKLYQTKLETLAGFVLFFIFSIISSAVFGQATASFNYNTQTGTLGTTYSWIDCSAGASIVSGDDAQASISWPFNFNFYDNSYTTANNLSVSTNGFIRLDGDAGTNYSAASAYNLTGTSTGLGQIIAMGVYDGKVGDNSGWVRSLVTGTAPNRIFTIEYKNLEINYNADKYANIQVSFYESVNKIVLKFGTDNVTQAGADMGIHSGVNGYFNKWQEVASGTNNTWIEYTPPYIEVNATIGTSVAFYSTLKAAFDKINDGTHRGAITIKIKNNTTEIAPAVINASGTGSASYASVQIYPTVAGLSISGDLPTPLIDLNGADNVTIDGRVNATGTTKDLTLNNTSTSSVAGTSTVRFINDASNNTIKYCTIKGSETAAASGILFFSTTSASNGSNNNTISNNNITSSVSANRPVNAIYSSGTAGKNNSGNSISTNSIFDFLNPSTASNGILLSAYTFEWTIDGNSFYETATFIPAANVTYNAIQISNASGNGFVVTNNYIGGNSALCGGTAWMKTNAANNLFTAINLNVSTTTASSVQNNTIQNFSWSNSASASWSAIAIAGGDVNIGTTTGNIIGTTTGNGSVTVTGATSGLNVYGISITGSGTVDCRNNTIAAITSANGAALASNIYGINISATAGTTTISNNTIGSTATTNSINASSTSTGNVQLVYGIYNAGTGSVNISNNTISKLNNGTTNTGIYTRGVIQGIKSVNGTITIAYNTIYDLSIANANASDKVDATNNPSVCGMALTGTANAKTVTGNTIYNLSNSYTSFGGSVMGIYFTGSTSANVVSGNFIHSLSVSATSGSANIYGIKIAAGVTTYSNNIINLGGNTKTTVFGIYETGAAGNNNNLYFNTVYIGGTLASGSTNKSYALFSNASTNVRDFRNNIFMNTRSTFGGVNLHYAAYFNYSVNTSLTADYNNYYVAGTGGVLGYYGTNKTSLPIITGQDANSLAINPNFTAAGGTTAIDYVALASLPGVAGTGITTDYNGIIRIDPPKMGALESGTDFIWQGNTSTDFATATNWESGTVPPNGVDISFAATPANDCYLDQARTLKNITNTSAKKLVINAKQLTLTGSIISATANQIDATAASSVVIFAGTAAQSIPAGAFVTNTIDGVTVNNSSGLTQNGNITVQTNLALTNGAFIIGASTLTINGSITKTMGSLTGGNSSNIIIGGSGAGTNLPSVTLNNLTLNRNNGISLSGNVSVGGTLTLTSGTLTVGANTLTIAGNAPIVTSGNIDAGNALASLVFTNASGITLPASVFSGAINNLTINGSGITANNDIVLNGILNLQGANPSTIKGSLDMNSHTLNMGVAATTTGIGDVTGTIRRQHTFTGNVHYSFGNEYTTITFLNTGTKPAWVSCKVSIGIVPGWRSTAVKRVYSFAKDAGDDKAIMNLHYLDSELNSGETNEFNLVLWDHHNLPTPNYVTEPHGKSNNSEVNNWVGISGMSINYIAPSAIHNDKQWGLSYSEVTRIIWTGLENNGDWSSAGNWNSGVPTSTKDVLIPAGLTTIYPTHNSLSGTQPANAKSIEIEAGASITVDNYDITIYGNTGAWINNGTFVPGTGNVIFANGTITNVVSIGGSTNFYNLTVNDNTYIQPVTGSVARIAGILTAGSGSILDLVATNNTIEFNGSGQTVLNPIGPGTDKGYYKLILSGSGTKTMPSTPLTVIDQFVVMGTASATAASVLTIGGKLEIHNGATFATGNFNHTVGGHFDNSGTFIPTAGTTITLNGTALQNIYGTTPTSFEKLTINNAAGVDIFTDITVNNTLTLTNGNLNVGATTLTMNGEVVKTGGFINVNALSSLTFGGTTTFSPGSSIFLSPPNINNLTINRTLGIVVCCDFTVNGVLNLQSANPSGIIGTLDMGSYTLNMGEDATTIGMGDVTGIVSRTSVFVAYKQYTFGNKFTFITFNPGGTYPTQIWSKTTIGTSPSWKPSAIKRINDYYGNGGTGFTFSYTNHYLDSELNGNDESKLVRFKLTPPSTVVEVGRTDYNLTDNWVTNSNLSYLKLGSSFGGERTLANSDLTVLTWTGAISNEWNIQGNWSPISTPTEFSNIIIPDASSTPNDPTLTTGGVTINTIIIQNGGILNSGNQTLTINGSLGAWICDGTFNAGTGSVFFTKVDGTFSGSTNFYNITINSGASLRMSGGSTLRIAGVITNNGILHAVTDIATTVEYNGANQTVVVPNPATNRYSNLILSGSGNKTMPAAGLNIYENFIISGTTTVTANAAITINGTTKIESGATFITGNFNHILKGNFQNNGTLTASSGNSISFGGSVSQTISGSSTTNFNILNVDNSAGVIQTSLVNVNSTLQLNNGNLTVGNTTLSINGSISHISGYLSVSSISSLIFGGSTSLILGNNLFATAPTLNNLTINRSGGVTLANQSITVNGVLDLISGTFTIGANTLTLAGSSPTRTNGTINAGNVSATLVFANSTPVTLPGSIFTGNVNNLTINGAGGITAGSDITLINILNLQSANPSTFKGSLDMAGFTLNMGANATTVGPGDVTGIVKREHTFLNGVEYSFGNQYTNLNFLGVTSSTKPTWVSCKISIGTAPTWRGDAVKRFYSFAQSGGTDRMIVKLHYLDSELHGAETDETELVFWDAYDPALAPNNFILKYPRSYNGNDATNNWIELVGPAINYLATSATLDVKQWGLSYSNVTTHKWIGLGSVSYPGDWSLPGHWEGGVPHDEDDVLIPATLPTGNSGYPYRNLLPVVSPAVAKSIKIESGAILNSNGYNITISGAGDAWVNNGTFTAGSGTIIFIHGDVNEVVNLKGTTSFNNLTASSKTFLQAASGSITRIWGTFNVESDSKLDFTSNANTVEYNGSVAQNIFNQPSEPTAGYYHLIFSGSGTKTLSQNELKIYGNLTTNAVVAATGNTLTFNGSAAQSITGTSSPTLNNLTISNTTSPVTSSVNLTCSGNFTNSGVFDMTSAALAVAGTVTNSGTVKTASVSASPLPAGRTWGGTVQYYNSTGNQTAVGGTFNNLTFSNVSGTQSAGGNLNVNSILTTTSGGFLNMGTNQLSGTLSTINNGGTIRTQNTSATPIPANKTWGGTIQYNALAGGQTVMAGSYNILALSNTGGTQTAGGDISATTFNTSAGGTLNMGTNALAIINISHLGILRTQNTSSTPFTSGKTWGGTVIFDGTSGQTLPTASSTFNNLTVSNTTGVTAAANQTVNGILNLSVANPNATHGSLDMATYTLEMGLTGTTTGTGDVTGIVKRTGSFAGNVSYSFGNQYTTVAFINTGTKPSWLSCQIVLNAILPTKTGSVLRYYGFAVDATYTDQVIAQLHYLDSELNGNAEGSLVFWDKNSGGIGEHGNTGNNTADNWVELTGLPISYFAPSASHPSATLWGLSNSELTRNTWSGAIDTQWDVIANWTGGHVPLISEDVLIQNTSSGSNRYPSLTTTSNAVARTLEIEPGASVNANAETINISGATGAWVNNGTFVPGTGTVTLSHGSLSDVVSISGTSVSSFYNLTAGSTVYLQPSSGSVIKIAGALTQTAGSILDFTATENTVEYNGSASQLVIDPIGPGTDVGYEDLIISGGPKTFQSTLHITGELINHKSGLSITGEVILTDNGDGYPNEIIGEYAIDFENLTLANTAAPTVTTVDITASGNLTVNSGAIFQPGTTNTVGGTGTLTGSGTAKVTGLAAINSFCTQYPGIAKDLTNLTVDYNGAGNQTVCAESYGNLVISPNGTRTVTLAGSGIIYVSGIFDPDQTLTNYIVTGSTMNSNGTGSQTVPAFNYYNTIVSGNRGGGTITLANNGVIGIAGHSSVTATNATFVINNSTIDFNGSGDQSIDPFTFWNVIFSGGGSKTTSGDLAVIGSITVKSGVTLNMSSSILSGAFNGGFNNQGAIKTACPTTTSSTPLPSGKTWGGTIEYSGSDAQSLVAGTYNNLTMSGAGGGTAVADFTVNGTLNLAHANPSSTLGILHTDTYTLTMGESSTTIGAGDVTGIVKREHSFGNSVNYCFGNQFTTINFLGIEGATKPTWVSCKIEIGTAPVWRTENVKRIYSFLQAGGTDRTYTKLHYLDSELNALETDESKIIMYTDKDGLVTGDNTVALGKNSNDTGDNWVELLGMAINQIATSSITYAKAYGLGYTNVSKITWTGLGAVLYPGDWSLPGNWSGGVPTATDDVLIPAGLTTAYPNRNLLSSISPAHVKTLKIEAGATINVNDFDITVSGDANAWVNNGTFSAGNGSVIFNNGNSLNAATVAGNTNFYNLTVSDNTKIQTTAGSITGIGGSFSIGAGSILDFNSYVNTVIYNGNSSQNIPNPNGGATPGYYHLILSSGGTKTFPTATLKILGDLTINSNIITSGNTTEMSGSVLQTVSGSNEIEFNNLTIDNASGVSLNMDQLSKVLGTLQINTGKRMKIAANTKLTVVGSVINNGGNDGLTLLSNSTGSASLIHNTNGVDATMERYIGGAAENWHFLSSPVSNQTIAGSSWVPSGTYGNGSGYDLYVWDEPTQCWVYQLNTTGVPNWPAVHPSANFVPGRGYLYSVQAVNTTKAFAGDLNNGTVSYGLTVNGSTDINLQGFNLVGNTYPSSIDWMAASGWSRSNLMTNGGGYDMWIWNPEAKNYGVYNSADATGSGTNAVTRYIPAMQGFFVRAQTAGTLETSNDVRVHDATTLWKSAHLEPNRLIAVVHSETDHTFDEVRLLFGYSENKAGAAKLFSPVTTAPSLYLPEGKANFTVRYLTDTIANPHVPLMFKPGKDGFYTINFDFDNFDFDIAILEDRLTGGFTDLTLAPDYRFSASKSDNENRFIIHFRAITAHENRELPANIYNSGGVLVIDLTLVDELTDVKVVDVLGRTILQKSLNGNTIHRLLLNAKSQVFVVFAQTKNQRISKKVVVY